MQGPTTQTPHPRCSLSLQYAPKSTARTPQFLIIPRHQPFMSITSKTYITTRLSYWCSGEFQQFAKQFSETKKKPLSTLNHPPLPFFLPKNLPKSKTCLFVFSPLPNAATISRQIFLQLRLQLPS